MLDKNIEKFYFFGFEVDYISSKYSYLPFISTEQFYITRKAMDKLINILKINKAKWQKMSEEQKINLLNQKLRNNEIYFGTLIKRNNKSPAILDIWRENLYE